MEPLKEIYENRWDTEELKQVRKVWEIIVKDYFQKFVPQNAAVLDVGCGYCHFVNLIDAKEKTGIDANPDVKNHANKDVKIVLVNNLSLDELEKDHYDVAFVSNFLEHLENSTEVLNLLSNLKKVLKKGGKVFILQPNFRLIGRRYFDFIDHKTILTDTSLEEAFSITGYKVVHKVVRFLPYTTKSKIPKWPSLVKLYLKLRPIWLLMGKQSFYIIEKQ
ncbi:class I SAM-dependent methyltransferase [Cohnella yongneupensis]|uniref:Class I SAM-dependent methyltransferase n=1 Tax=Cohnella yongneupensis TaxID=425006 RepID=A0ABW0QZE2_9BACL